MNEFQAKHLLELFSRGYLIMIDASPYLDSKVNSMYEDENGHIVYSSQVYSERPVREVGTHDVQVYRPAVEVWANTAEYSDDYYLDEDQVFLAKLKTANAQEIADMGLSVDCVGVFE